MAPEKHPNTERFGGPGASHENAKTGVEQPHGKEKTNEGLEGAQRGRLIDTDEKPSAAPAPKHHPGPHQESQHNKHNDPGQPNHKPQ